MKRLIIDGAKINGYSHLHDVLSDSLGFDDYYGKNLDALWDMLSEMSELLLISVINTEELAEALDDKFDPFMEVLSDADNDLENVFVRFDSFYLIDFCTDRYKEDVEYNIIYDDHDMLRFRFFEMGVVIEETSFTGDVLNELIDYLILMFPWAKSILCKELVTNSKVKTSDYTIYDIKE